MASRATILWYALEVRRHECEREDGQVSQSIRRGFSRSRRTTAKEECEGRERVVGHPH